MNEPACSLRSFVGLAVAGLCAVALVTAASAVAQPPSNTARDSLRDLQLMIHARKALREDPALASCNFGLGVHDGVATLWGPAPSADLIAKATRRVGDVQGILGVRSNLYVALPDREAEAPVIPLLPPEPLRTESASPDHGPSTLEQPVPVIATTPQQPPLETRSEPAPATPAEQPIAIRPSQARPVSRSAANPSDGLLAAIERIRQSDPRFRTVRVEVRGGTVVIAASRERDEQAMALAQIVSRLAGVERVVTKTD
jgi:osmotically-inducible protein OsmY